MQAKIKQQRVLIEDQCKQSIALDRIYCLSQYVEEYSQFLRSSIAEKKQKILLKKLSTKPKFFSYDLNNIDEQSRKQMKKILCENVSISRNIKLGNVLLSNQLLSGMTQNVKSVEYGAAVYPVIVREVENVFREVMGVGDKNVFIAKGEVSQEYYVFFNNCFQVPYSRCCSEIVYLRIQICKLALIGSFRRISRATLRNLGEMGQQKIKLICQKCRRQLVQFYGQENKEEMERLSPQKIQQYLDIENQRKKLSIGVMVGSGKHKSYRLSGLKRKDLETSRRFNPESLFGSAAKQKRMSVNHPQTSLKASKIQNNQNFYPLYFQ